MLNESIKILLALSLVFFNMTTAVFADSALMPVWDEVLANGGVFGNLQQGGIFSSGGYSERLNTNCTYRDEYNPYTKQTTRNQICNPHVVSYYKQPTVTKNTQQAYDYYRPTTTNYNYPTPKKTKSYYDALSYYSGSNIWYPQNNYGYSNSSMFNTYYANDRYDYYYDSPRLCYNGGRNCGGYYDGVDGLIYDLNAPDAYYDRFDNFYLNIAY